MGNVAVSRSKKGVPPKKITLQTVHAELNRLRERAEDLEDLRELNEAIGRNKGKRLIPWDVAKKDLGIED